MEHTSQHEPASQQAATDAAAASASPLDHDAASEAASADDAAAASAASTSADPLSKPTHHRHWTHTFADGRVEPRLHSTGDPRHFLSPRAHKQQQQQHPHAGAMPATLDSDEEQSQASEQQQEPAQSAYDQHRPVQHIADDADEDNGEFAIPVPPSRSPARSVPAAAAAAAADDDAAVAMEESDGASEAEAATATAATRSSAQNNKPAATTVVEEPAAVDAPQEAAGEEEQPGDNDDDGEAADDGDAAAEEGGDGDDADNDGQEEGEAEETGDADEEAAATDSPAAPVSAPQPLPTPVSASALPAVVDSDDDVQLIEDDAEAAMDDEYRDGDDGAEEGEDDEAGDEEEAEYGDGGGGDYLDADEHEPSSAGALDPQEEFGEGVAEDDDDDAAPLPISKPFTPAQQQKDADDEEVVDLTLSDDDEPAAGATESETEHKYDSENDDNEQEAATYTQQDHAGVEITDRSSPPANAAAAPFASRADSSPAPSAAAAAASSAAAASASPALAAAASPSSSVSPSPPSAAAVLKPLFISPFASSPHKSFGSRNGQGKLQPSQQPKASFMSPTHRPSRSPLPIASVPSMPDAATASAAAASSAAAFCSPAPAAAAAPSSATALSDRGRMSIKQWPQAKVPALHHPPPRRAPLITRISYCWDSLVPQFDPRPRDYNERRLPGAMVSRPFNSAFEAAAAAASRRAHASTSSFHALERERLARRAEQLAKQEQAIQNYAKRRMQPVEDELAGLLSSMSMTDVAPATSTTYRTASLAQRDAYIGADITRRIFVAKAAPAWLVSALLSELLSEAVQETVIETVADAKRLAPLPEAEMKRSTELISAPPGKMIADKFNIEITGKELSCLRNLNWLNDETMNFYFEMLAARATLNRATPATKVLGSPAQLSARGLALMLPSLQDRLHFFNSFFYTKLSGDGGTGGYNYKNVSRWMKRSKVDIALLDKIVLPVHVGHNHWCLAVINLKLRRFEYYDSLGGSNPECLRHLRRYLIDELTAQCGAGKAKELCVDSWSDLNVKGIPQQNNGSDCGVFTMMFANYIAENRPFEFTFRDMPYFRRRIALEIAAQKVL